MPTITIPIEIELTPRSRAIMAALAEADSQQAETPSPTPALQPGEHYAGVVLNGARPDRQTPPAQWLAGIRITKDIT